MKVTRSKLAGFYRTQLTIAFKEDLIVLIYSFVQSSISYSFSSLNLTIFSKYGSRSFFISINKTQS